MRENIADLLVTSFRRFGPRTAIVRGAREVSFAEVEDRAARLAAFLRDQGVRPGERAGIALRNSAEYVETMLGASWIGALPVNVNHKYKAEELLHVLDDAHISVLVHDRSVGQRLSASDRQPCDTSVWIAADDADPYPTSAVAVRYDDALAGPRIDVDPPRAEGDWLLYTGGTTGLPKGVLSRHGDLIRLLGRRAFDYLEVPTPGDRRKFIELIEDLAQEPQPRVVNLVAPPAMHATGTYATLGTLLTGGTVVYLSTDSYRPDDMAQLIEKYSVTHLTIVGDAFARPLVAELRRGVANETPYDLSSLTCVHSVGAAWSATSKASLLEFCDVEIEDVLASTETGRYAAIVTRREGDHVHNALLPFPGVRVVRDDGTDVVAGSEDVGYLAVPVSDAVTYVGDSGDDSSFRVIDGTRYCLPGDLAVARADGALDLRGRASRAINTGGEKVFAEEVEGVLLDHPQVNDALVVGRDHDLWGSAVVALVVAEDPRHPPVEDALRQHVSNRLANYKSPKQIRVVEEIPRLASGKADLRWTQSLQW